MKYSDFNNRIQIQAKSTAQDELGQPIEDWETQFTVWASIRHLSGMETVRSGVEVSNVKASIRIRYMAGVTAAMRIKHGADVYSIEAVMPDKVKREFVDLVCYLGANDG